MISIIKGSIQKYQISKDSYVDLLTSCGIGYRVFIPSSYILPQIGQEFSLFTHFHVREDAQTLYGFTSENERDFFEQLIQVSGVGPKIGMSILSAFSRDEIEKLIEEGDARALSKVPGLGMKRAQKIIIELRGIIDLTKSQVEESSMLKDVKEALKTLGFDSNSVKEKLSLAEKLLKESPEITAEQLIKEVIRN
ncbi:Holliday junction branch migration protein RuvA [Candidatus Dojkabacteria bacterium]|jgi:Holliday junction DNA helicase RuvA|nr:Holliday junction branch migration protein RuvA [Candidatus Dojkabacteria bacterium]HRY74570.1 Holliday junction branch migration protein RuvA [Candidatus Dojkabacteria bacterium]HRZ84912.1 Holliday junction branch migration protein RuvA [Candidatus Dojkabacteria bacterium]